MLGLGTRRGHLRGSGGAPCRGKSGWKLIKKPGLSQMLAGVTDGFGDLPQGRQSFKKVCQVAGAGEGHL